MKPKTRTTLNRLHTSLEDSLVYFHRMARVMNSSQEKLPVEIADMDAALVACQESIEDLNSRICAVFDADVLRPSGDESLTETEIHQLLMLNRRLREVDPLLKSIADDVTPRLDAKVADPNDPMVDYEIEVLLNFVLREDDPDYEEDDDNYLTRRRESLKHLWQRERTDFIPPWGPTGLRAEPHCWRFHDLYDYEYGVESPHLSYRDCLRIGRILIDVQIWQQYDFDVTVAQRSE